ncbi:hypothetical protein CPB84DRAFT_1684367 [Gymnopilus junonius]|uniref:Uncharacterized protein n=1 Tax=Gymnopilus junonius TaxID=109634 RepID=A0A9P5TL24_GYMJU|nr:hypothetical protein CPB84DRAFT_1684367 [Gymnopilus junonius]
MSLAFNRPAVSSPLAAASSQSNFPAIKRTVQKRNSSFPSSRALRPFPTISHILQPPSPTATPSSSGVKKPVKLIEPPENFKTTFVLDLTQAEFSRQDN